MSESVNCGCFHCRAYFSQIFVPVPFYYTTSEPYYHLQVQLTTAESFYIELLKNFNQPLTFFEYQIPLKKPRPWSFAAIVLRLTPLPHLIQT